MPKLGEILKRPLGAFVNVEAQLPRGAPKVSKFLIKVADALPKGPDLPDLGKLGAGRAGAEFKLPKMAGIFRSVEEILPKEAPKVSALAESIETKVRGAVRPGEEVAPAPTKPRELIFE